MTSVSLGQERNINEKIILGVRIKDTVEKRKKKNVDHRDFITTFCSFETIMKANARPYSHFELLPMIFNVVLYRF